MRTSLNNIKAIEDHLLGNLSPGEKLLFDANMLLNEDMASDIEHQQDTYAIITQYGRQKIKAEIITVQNMLATSQQHKGFMQRIVQYFIKQ